MSMTTPEKHFERELEIFRTEAEAAIQFFYADRAVHAVAAKHPPVYRLLNQAPLFWNTALGALQTASFIALGRVFDQRSPHNVDALLRIAQAQPGIFSRNSLALRKQGTDPNPPGWLPEYLRDAYVPTAADFRRLQVLVDKRRAIYNTNYRALRNKVFAHRDACDPARVSALFARTNIRELQRLLVFLSSLYDALWELFFNGRKPVLRPRRYSVTRMIDLPSSAGRREALQERITHEAEQFLLCMSGVANNAYHHSGDGGRMVRK